MAGEELYDVSMWSSFASSAIDASMETDGDGEANEVATAWHLYAGGTAFDELPSPAPSVDEPVVEPLFRLEPDASSAGAKRKRGRPPQVLREIRAEILAAGSSASVVGLADRQRGVAPADTIVSSGAVASVEGLASTMPEVIPMPGHLQPLEFADLLCLAVRKASAETILDEDVEKICKNVLSIDDQHHLASAAVLEQQLGLSAWEVPAILLRSGGL
eukprot:1357809-Amphidinium_carterae.2